MKWLWIIALGATIWWYWPSKLEFAPITAGPPPRELPAGPLQPENQPVQETCPPVRWHRGGYEITAVATFDIDAVLLLRSRHRDALQGLTPLDFVLVWGPLAEPAQRTNIQFSQTGRMYHYRYRTADFPAGYIGRHSANVHLIPANNEVFERLLDAKKEKAVRLSGYLVNVQLPDALWKSSLSRTDSGVGACELLWVEAVRLE